VTPGHGKSTCGWIAPDGERVLFASTHDDPDARTKMAEEIAFRASGATRRYSWDYDPTYEIYAKDLASGETTRLTDALGYDAEGSYSPDGQRIVFASNRAAYEGELTDEERARLDRDPASFIDLYVMDADGGNVQRITDNPTYDGGPFFSPDGQRITWRRFGADGKSAEIWTARADGTDARQVTRLGALSWAPFYHPSGDYLIFATNLLGYSNFELYMVDAEGAREPVRVTFTEGFDGLPVFAPDGDRISWTSGRTTDGAAQIFLADWDDARARELLALSPSAAQATTEAVATQSGILAEDAMSHVRRLASPELEGRLTGTEGERLATAYVAEQFARFGLQPAGTDGWYQPFTFPSGVRVQDGNRLRIQIGQRQQELTLDKDWRPIAFSTTGEVEASAVVFAGYGIVAPAEGDLPAYDAYGDLDVKDKWVMVLRFMPEGITPERRVHLHRYATLRYKAMEARNRGARGLIVVSGPTSKARSELVPLAFDASLSGAGIAAVSLTDGAAAELFAAGSGPSLEEAQTALDDGEVHAGFLLDGVSVEGAVALASERSNGRNVIGVLQVGPEPSAERVVLGAHVDHLGRGHGGDSLAREEERNQIHFGADDNASGVAAMLEIAEYLAEERAQGRLAKARRDIVFVAWSGEEMGLLGSNHFVKTYGGSTEERTSLRPDVAAYLNLDMVGRLSSTLILQGLGSSPQWRGFIERANVAVGVPVQLSDATLLPTDATPFYLKEVPILSAFTGSHEDYHTPRDVPERVNGEGVAQIARLFAGVVKGLSVAEEAPTYVRKTEGTEPTRRMGRVWLGTLPDYTGTEVKGMRVSGASGGSPAEQAGIRSGDVIVELAGRTVENIYDFMHVLDALKIGEPVPLVVEREGARVALEITPGSRQ
jgi:Tol biopolymer transport system component